MIGPLEIHATIRNRREAELWIRHIVRWFDAAETKADGGSRLWPFRTTEDPAGLDAGEVVNDGQIGSALVNDGLIGGDHRADAVGAVTGIVGWVPPADAKARWNRLLPVKGLTQQQRLLERLRREAGE